jgi:hypothetical protein
MIRCTACNQTFPDWEAWQEHRPPILVQQMAHYDGHTRRCLTLREWAYYVLDDARRRMEAKRKEASWMFSVD